MNENVLNADNWKVEADAVINDIKSHVLDINVSEGIPCTDQHIYLNITTIENRNYCVELSRLGFRVCGNNHDEKDLEGDTYFETPYSLLNKISPMFDKSFGNALLQKLNELSEK